MALLHTHLITENNPYQLFSALLWLFAGLMLFFSQETCRFIAVLMAATCIFAAWDEYLLIHECLKMTYGTKTEYWFLASRLAIFLPFLFFNRSRVAKLFFSLLAGFGMTPVLLDIVPAFRFSNSFYLEEFSENLFVITLILLIFFRFERKISGLRCLMAAIIIVFSLVACLGADAFYRAQCPKIYKVRNFRVSQ